MDKLTGIAILLGVVLLLITLVVGIPVAVYLILAKLGAPNWCAMAVAIIVFFLGLSGSKSSNK